VNIATLLFWPVVAMTLTGAAGAAFARNMVYAALSLGVSLAGVAGLYFFQTSANTTRSSRKQPPRRRLRC